MNRLLRCIVEGTMHDLGVPYRLRHVLASAPEAPSGPLTPPRSIDGHASVVRWNELGSTFRESGHLIGWHYRRGAYLGMERHRPEYARMELMEEQEDWVCDLAQVDGFSASKSTLRDFTSTDQLVEVRSREMIDRIDAAKLAENLAHPEIRILNRARTSDHFYRFAWDGRLFLANAGGSHHLAAAKYIATRMGHKVELRGTLRTYALNEDAVQSLCGDYEMLVMPDSAALWNDTYDALHALRATWYHHPLPRHAGKGSVVLLPRSERRSMAAARDLHRAGWSSLNDHFKVLLDKQRLFLSALLEQPMWRPAASAAPISRTRVPG